MGISFWQLISQARVNESVEKILVARSLVDRQDVEVINLDINWRKSPPLVQLNVRATEPITQTRS